jgi:hypothetical protein
VCAEWFESLTEHLQSFRPQQATNLSCGQCGREFKDERALGQHEERTHKNKK